MTDEEMAEEYKADYGIDLCCLCRECEVENIIPCQHKKDAMYGYKDGFLAGLKAGRPQWHDLRKDKNDLPPKMLGNSNFSIEVLSDRGELVCYNFHYCEWFYWRRGSPIAWCEIPTFDKE
jgi:hypothetical protein